MLSGKAEQAWEGVKILSYLHGDVDKIRNSSRNECHSLSKHISAEMRKIAIFLSGLVRGMEGEAFLTCREPQKPGIFPDVCNSPKFTEGVRNPASPSSPCTSTESMGTSLPGNLIEDLGGDNHSPLS